MAKIINQLNDVPINKENTKYLAKKPEVTGIPAKESMATVIQTAIKGWRFAKPLNASKLELPFSSFETWYTTVKAAIEPID